MTSNTDRSNLAHAAAAQSGMNAGERAILENVLGGRVSQSGGDIIVNPGMPNPDAQEGGMVIVPGSSVYVISLAQQGCSTCPVTTPAQNSYEKVVLTAGSGFLVVGDFSIKIAQEQIANKAVRATAEGIKVVKLLGRGVTGVQVGISMYQLYSGAGHASDYARFGGSLVIARSAAIPLVGKYVSLGLGIADAAGAFEGFYKSFDEPEK